MLVPVYLPRYSFWKHAIPSADLETGHFELDEAYRKYRLSDQLSSRAYLYKALSRLEPRVAPETVLRAVSLECLLEMGDLAETSPLLAADPSLNAQEMLQAASRAAGQAVPDPNPQNRTLLSERWTRQMSGDPPAFLAPWIALFEAAQVYHFGDHAQAARIWLQLAADDSLESLFRGFVQLGILQIAAEYRSAYDATNAAGRAYEAFRQVENRSGCAQAQLSAAEFDYLVNKPRLAEVELQGAGTIFEEEKQPQGLADVNIVGGLGSGVTGDLKLAEDAIRATEQTLLRPRIPRIADDQVQRLVEFSRRIPSLRGFADPQPRDSMLAELRDFHRWAYETGDPVLQLLSLVNLAHPLKEAGFWSDAFFYRSLAHDLEERYIATVPLSERILRAALLDYDFLSRMDPKTEPALNYDFEAQAEGLFASQVLLRGAALDQIPGVDRQAAEEGFQAYAQALRGIAAEGKEHCAAILERFAAGDRPGSAKSVAEMFADLKLLFHFVNEFTQSKNIVNTELTVNRSIQKGGKKAYRAHVELAGTLIFSRPSRNHLEIAQHETHLDLMRDVWGAVIVKNPEYVQRGADRLARFYEEHRDAIHPPRSLNWPFTFLHREGIGTLPPDQSDLRNDLINKGLNDYLKRYISQLIQAALEEDPEAPPELGNYRGSDAEQAAAAWMESNFQIETAKSAVTQHQASRSEAGGEILLAIRHACRVEFALRQDSEYYQAPPGVADSDLQQRARTIRSFWEKPPLPAREPRFDKLLELFHFSKGTERLLGQYGVIGLDEWLDKGSAFNSILEAGQMALSAQGTGDFLARPHLRTFEDWKQLLRTDPDARRWAVALSQINPSTGEDATEQTQTAIRNMFQAFGRADTQTETPSGEQPLRTIMNWGAIALLLVGPILRQLLDDAPAAAAAAQALSANLQNRAPENRTAAQWQRDALSLALYHIAAGALDHAIVQLNAILESAPDADITYLFQIQYLRAICWRRLGDSPEQTAEQIASLRLAVEDLERLRGTLRTRYQALALLQVRRLIFEEYLRTLFTEKRYPEMASAIHRYRRSTQLPVSILLDDGSSQTEVSELIRQTVFLYDVLSREEIWRVEDSTWFALFKSANLTPEEKVDPRQAANAGLDSIANVLVEQLRTALSNATAEDEGIGPISAGTLAISYFVGGHGLYRVAANATHEVSARWVALDERELSQACIRFRAAIEEQSELPTELYELLLGELPGLDRVSHLQIAPDGMLNFIPYEALRRDAGAGYLVETHTVTYATGAVAFVNGATAPRPQQILVIGDPDGTLPAAEDEARSIARLDAYAHRAPLLRGQASLKNLRTRLAEAGLVHFATHAVANQLHPNFAYLQLAGWDRLYSIDLGGLLFSDKHVFLSACETRLGEVAPGEDIYGIADAFLAAGASSVICTQWRIEDESTALFAARYYQLLAESQNPSTALAFAQREFISGKCRQRDGEPIPLSNPFYWAGFVHLVPWSACRPAARHQAD